MKPPCHAHPCAELPELTERLRQRSHKITGPRQAILAVLRQQQRPLSIKDIFAQLTGETCDLATVYRSLRLLEEMKMVQRCDFGDGQARFELLGECGHKHHHHLICTQCAAAVQIEECVSLEIEQRLAARSGFKAVTHKLEFFGICPRCQKSGHA